MLVEVQATEACPNAALVLDRLYLLSTTYPKLHVLVRLVEVDEPIPDGFSGSPPVLIDGTNPSGALTEAAACALHPPTADQVEAAVKARW